MAEGDSKQTTAEKQEAEKKKRKLHVTMYTEPPKQQSSVQQETPADIANVPKESKDLEHDEILDDFLKRWERQPAPGNNLEQTVAEAADVSKPIEKTYTATELNGYCSELKIKYEKIVALVNTPESLNGEGKNLLKEYGQIVDILAKHCPSLLSKHAEEVMTLNEKLKTATEEYEAKLHVTENRYKADIEELESRIKNFQNIEAEDEQEQEPITAIRYLYTKVQYVPGLLKKYHILRGDNINAIRVSVRDNILGAYSCVLDENMYKFDIVYADNKNRVIALKQEEIAPEVLEQIVRNNLKYLKPKYMPIKQPPEPRKDL